MAPDDETEPPERFRAALARAGSDHPRRLAEVLLADPTLPDWLPALPVQDLYWTLREIGLGDAAELLELASPEQVRGFLDLDAWSGAELQPARAAEWIDALAAIGPETLVRAVRALDPELLGLLVQRQARVYDVTTEALPEEPEGHFYSTPDTFFVLDVLAPGEAGKRLERLIEWLYSEDPELGRRAVMLAKWELPSEMEESAYRWRSGRMADLGYADHFEALEVYRWLDPQSVKLGEGSADKRDADDRSPSLSLRDAGDGFLARALAAVLDPGERERLQGALALLANRVMAADRVEPSDAPAARASLDRAAGTLALGLEYLGRGDPKRAAEALASIALSRIFRVGFSLTLKLKRAADALAAHPLVTLVPGRLSLLDEPLERAITLLRAPRPERAAKGGPRPFSTLAELGESAALLEEAAQQAALVQHGLGVDPERLTEENLAGVSPPRAEIRLRAVVATLLANALCDRPPALVPIPPGDLAELRRRALDPAAPDRLRALVDERLAERRYPPPPALGRLIETWIAHLQAAVAPSTVGAPASDPYSLTGLLVR